MSCNAGSRSWLELVLSWSEESTAESGLAVRLVLRLVVRLPERLLLEAAGNLLVKLPPRLLVRLAG